MTGLIRIAVLIASLVLPGTAALAQSGGIIRQVQVEGAQRVEPDTVRSYLLIQPGDAYEPSRIDRSLKSLFATGLFADVTLKREGDVLVVSVVENPVINRVAFEGNRKLEDKDLETEVTLKPRMIYTRAKVQQDVKRVLTLYRRSGRFAATVEPKVIQLPQNRVDLVFEIEEGDPTAVRSVRFVGNGEFGDGRLREVVRTKESRWYRMFSSDDTYDPDRLTLDRELLRRFYMDKGFADFRVVSGIAELTPDRKAFFITFTVEEGNRYALGKVDVDVRLRDVDPQMLRDQIEIETGDWYSAKLIDKTLDTLSMAIGDTGLPFADVRPRINRDREKRIIDVVYEVSEGPRVFVERIDVTGNMRTVDNVVRREFRMVEGDAFNSAKLKRSKTRLQNLDFFEKVNVEQLPGSAPDKTVIAVDVAEKSTGSLTLGAGYSTAVGPMGDVGVRERNLLGKGYDLKSNFTLSAKRSSIDAGFTDPYFMDREVAGGVDAFHFTQDNQDTSSYDFKKTGGALRAGYPITENLRQNWRYTLAKSEMTNVAAKASQAIKSQEGTTTMSQVTHGLAYDRRDSKVKPTEGYVVRLTNDVAGLGGTTHFLRNKIDGTKYYELHENWILSVKGAVGHIVGLSEDVRVIDRYFVGGDDLRGFAIGGVGPRDKSTGDSLGGEWMYTASAQVAFPLGLPEELGVAGHIFMDAGSAGKGGVDNVVVNDTGAIRAAIGAGVTWASPMGPIGIDFGIPILKESFDKTESFRFQFGTKF
ncbi:MAG: outer membrane protein assembly factor BamA [Magnetospirillum sp. WYHS-4]